jgi:signal peptidase II
VALGVVILDQLTKTWALRAAGDEPIELIADVLQIRVARNTGAAFSILTGWGPLIGIVAVGVVVLIFVALGDAGHRFEAIGLGLILGGAVGNLLDRVVRGDGFFDGAVVDFVDFDFFPTFNVADAALNVGVAFLLIAVFLRR